MRAWEGLEGEADGLEDEMPSYFVPQLSTANALCAAGRASERASREVSERSFFENFREGEAREGMSRAICCASPRRCCWPTRSR